MSEDKFIRTMTGKVKHVHKNDSDLPIYGFIEPDDSTVDDVFLHHKEIEPWRKGFKQFEQGQVVKFDLYKTPRGLSAKNVEIKRDKADMKDFQSVPDNIGNQGVRNESC